MEMTYEQSQDYNKLTIGQKEDFEYSVRKHPNWTFAQHFTKVVFEKQVDDTVEKGGSDVDREDPVMWLTILEGVKATLKKFKSVVNTIFNVLDGVISSIKGMIAVGVKKIGDIIDRFFDNIF